MNIKPVIFGLLLFSLAGSIVAQTPQTPTPTAKPAAKPASKPATKPVAGARSQASVNAAARKQLDSYLLEFQSKPDDAALRQKIVTLAKTLNPEPAIPRLKLHRTLSPSDGAIEVRRLGDRLQNRGQAL